MNIFDIMGPIMVGPSSSHTAGAARMGRVARHLLGSQPVKADIQLHGSFAATGSGHGTDRAIVAGLLDLAPDHPDIPRSFQLAQEAGMEVSIRPVDLPGAHPNTALLTLTDAQEGNDFYAYQGESWHSTVLKPGEFLVVFPGDAHRIKVQVDGPKTVSKAVFKVCIDA